MKTRPRRKRCELCRRLFMPGQRGQVECRPCWEHAVWIGMQRYQMWPVQGYATA
jgi:hypothetical protein